MSNSRQMEIEHIDNTTNIDPQFQEPEFISSDEDLSSNFQMINLYKDLKKYVLDVQKIIKNPHKNEAKKIKLIKEAMQVIDFKQLTDSTAYSTQEVAEDQTESKEEENSEEKLHERRINQLIQERDQYKKEAEQLKMQIERAAQANKVDLTNSLDEELMKLQGRKTSVDKVRQQLLQIDKKEIESLTARFKEQSEELRQQNQKFHQKIALLTEQVEALKKEAGKNQLYLIEQAKNKKLQVDIASKNEIIQTQEKALIDLNGQIKRLNTKFHDVEAQKSELRNENANLLKRYKSHQEIKSNFEGQNKKLSLKLSDKQAIIVKLEQSLSSRIRQLQDANNRISQLKAQRQKQNGETNQQFQKRISGFQQRISQLTAEVIANNQQLKQLRDYRTKNQQLSIKHQSEVAQKHRQILALREALERPVTQARLYQHISTFYFSLSTPLKAQFKRQMSIHIGSFP